MTQSATLDGLTTWRERNGKAPLREIAAAQAARLRAVHAPTIPRPASPVQQRIAAVQADSRWAGPTRTAPAPVAATKPDYKVADELAAQTPVGYYALPRREASSAGNTVTFFKVHPYRGGRRIVQVVGSTDGYTERPLSVRHQIFALQHILEDVAAAASLYGRTAKRCGFCAANGRNSELTNTRSLTMGYGSTCARTHGLPW